jgi:hypothetical protein
MEGGIFDSATITAAVKQFTTNSANFGVFKAAIEHYGANAEAKKALAIFFTSNPDNCVQFCKWMEGGIFDSAPITAELINRCAENPKDFGILQWAMRYCDSNPEAQKALAMFFATNPENCRRFCKLMAEHEQKLLKGKPFDPGDCIQITAELINLCAESEKCLGVIEKMVTTHLLGEDEGKNYLPFPGQVIRADLVRYCAAGDDTETVACISMLGSLLQFGVPGGAITLEMMTILQHGDVVAIGMIADAIDKFKDSAAKALVMKFFVNNPQNCIRFGEEGQF